MGVSVAFRGGFHVYHEIFIDGTFIALYFMIIVKSSSGPGAFEAAGPGEG
jgi:hypothetical protein